MRFWDPLGGRQEFSLLTFWRVITHRTYLVFLGLTLLLFFATDPSGNRDYVPLWGSATIWPIAYVMYMSLYAFMIVVLSGLTGRFPRLRTPTPLLGFLALVPTVYYSETVILNLMSGGTYPLSLQGKYLFYYLSVQVSEAVFFKYIFPNIPVVESDNDAATASEHDLSDGIKHVIIGGERIPLGNIHLIEAREHHVQVTLSESQLRLRARLGDIVAQTSPADGVQTHRSWWVARHAAQGLCEEDGRPVLRLNAGNRHVPIARTRVEDVRTWVQDHLVPESGVSSAAE